MKAVDDEVNDTSSCTEAHNQLPYCIVLNKEGLFYFVQRGRNRRYEVPSSHFVDDR